MPFTHVDDSRLGHHHAESAGRPPKLAGKDSRDHLIEDGGAQAVLLAAPETCIEATLY